MPETDSGTHVDANDRRTVIQMLQKCDMSEAAAAKFHATEGGGNTSQTMGQSETRCVGEGYLDASDVQGGATQSWVKLPAVFQKQKYCWKREMWRPRSHSPSRSTLLLQQLAYTCCLW